MWLRRDVRVCAVAADSTQHFLARVRSAGLLVRERYGEAGDLTGYAVAVPGDTTAQGTPIWFGGGRLAPDLTLPHLQRRWAEVCPGASRRSRAELTHDLRRAVNGALEAARAGRLSIIDVEGLGDALVSASRLLPGAQGDAVRQAADRYDRAAKAPQWRSGAASSALRRAARQLARSGVAVSRDDSAAALELVAALTMLSAALAQWHERQHRPHQAAAARSAQRHLCRLGQPDGERALVAKDATDARAARRRPSPRENGRGR